MFYLNLPGFFISIHISIISSKQEEIYFVCFFFLQIEQSLRIGIINASFCCVTTQLVHINVSKVSNCCNTTSSYECFKGVKCIDIQYSSISESCILHLKKLKNLRGKTKGWEIAWNSTEQL